ARSADLTISGVESKPKDLGVDDRDELVPHFDHAREVRPGSASIQGGLPKRRRRRSPCSGGGEMTDSYPGAECAEAKNAICEFPPYVPSLLHAVDTAQSED